MQRSEARENVSKWCARDWDRSWVGDMAGLCRSTTPDLEANKMTCELPPSMLSSLHSPTPIPTILFTLSTGKAPSVVQFIEISLFKHNPKHPPSAYLSTTVFRISASSMEEVM